MLIRKNCVICIHSLLKEFICFNDFPIKSCEDNLNSSNSLYKWDMHIGCCELCGSIQLMNLLDPTILYGGKYPFDTSYSIEWSQHHDQLADFIKNQININTPLIEIGASSCILANRLVKIYTDYTIFDFSLESAVIEPQFKYIEGNCENYNFNSESALIMSHVFEHLYDPVKFINNCKNNNVKDIVISIPNMNNKYSLHITREHTFTYTTNDIIYIFNCLNYTCVKYIEFLENHSIFYHFKLDNNSSNIHHIYNSNHNLYTKTFLNKKFTIPPNSILTGAGFWSQVLYKNITNNENITCIIDNDSTKQNKIFYNTNLFIYPFSILSTLSEPINVIVLKNKSWTNEIITKIHDLNQNANIIEI